jgi:hypothetical protein
MNEQWEYSGQVAFFQLTVHHNLCMNIGLYVTRTHLFLIFVHFSLTQTQNYITNEHMFFNLTQQL